MYVVARLPGNFGAHLYMQVNLNYIGILCILVNILT